MKVSRDIDELILTINVDEALRLQVDLTRALMLLGEYGRKNVTLPGDTLNAALPSFASTGRTAPRTKINAVRLNLTEVVTRGNCPSPF